MKPKKSSEPTINQAEIHTSFQNEKVEELLEPGVNAKSSIDLTVHEVLRCMNDVTVRRIGICGIGGSGMTSVLKALLNHLKGKSMYDVIIWVTMLRYWSIRKIQTEIFRQLSMCPPDSETDKGANELFQVLKSRKFLFLMDNVLERVDLDALGIPNPSYGCSIILTTRKLDVCYDMTVDMVVEMKQVSREEAWKLFREQVGELVDSPEIQPYARIIVEECGGLPLLIIVTGRALAGVNEASMWEDATREFLLPSTAQIYDVEAVVQQDREVDISELVKCCIQEGLISGNWSEAYQRGHDIVKTLVGASLLQSTNGGLAIKMHDVVRDLASAIMLGAEGLQFMLRLYSRSTESLNLRTNPSYKPIESPESNRSIPKGCGFLLEGGVGLRELPPKREQWE
ncbi:hypothetical protein ACE6H2_011140 [Prunus campanulata]